MGNQQPISGKIEKSAQRRVYSWRICNHFIGDTGELRNIFRNRNSRIDKGVECIQYLSALDFYSAYFRDFTVLHGQTGGFNIEYDHFLIETDICSAI